MSVREDIKSLLAKENCTMTEIASKMQQKTGKIYNVKTLSQKLTNSTLRYEEFKLIADILGYEIKLEKL